MLITNLLKRKKKPKHSIVKSKKVVRTNKDLPKKREIVLPNMTIVYLVSLMLLAGLLMIFSASAYGANKNQGDTFFFFKKQLIWILGGVVLGFWVYMTPLSVLRKLSAPLLTIGIVLLVIMLPEALGGVGADGNARLNMPFIKTLNGATRWIDLGFFDFQTAEYIKLAFIIYLSAWLSRERPVFKRIKDLKQDQIYNVIMPFLMLLGLVSVLILAQKDLDTAAIIVLTVLSVFYVSGTDAVYTVSSILILLFSTLFGGISLLAVDYRRQRLNAFLEILTKGEPSQASKLGESFQSWNGIVAIGYGGLFGRGYGESRLKLGFLQEAAYTDSIFAVIAEEFGFIGACLVIISFLYFASLGIDVARKAPDRFSSLLAVGVTSWISIQAFLNIAANLGVIPFGGMPLPFFSYGGSSTISIIIGVALLLRVSREGNAKNKKRIVAKL